MKLSYQLLTKDYLFQKECQFFIEFEKLLLLIKFSIEILTVFNIIEDDCLMKLKFE
jgi:hypothetical protein